MAQNLRNGQKLRKEILIERLAAFVAFASLLCVILVPSKPRLWQESLGDFKMVYASAAGLAHSGEAYSFAELTRVFKEGGVVKPESWYGHSPVYPPFTLLALSPLLLLPIVPAAYLWACLGYLAMALAAARLARYAGQFFGVPLGLRLLLIALMAASPLVSFGLDLANVSMVAACLCIFAATSTSSQHTWLHAVELAVALLLKPHLAFWVVLALFLLPQRLYRSDERVLATKALAIFAALLAPMVAYLLLRHQLFSLLESYARVLRAEAAGGSMDVRDHQAMMIPAQITSLGSLLGYWIDSTRVRVVLQFALLLPLTLCLLWATLRARPEWKTVVIGAWAALGLLVTYHRAHDGTVLFLLLPWTLTRVWRRWYDGPGWTVIVLYALFSIGPTPTFFPWLSSLSHLHTIGQVLLFRQVALAAALLVVALVLILLRAAVLDLDPFFLGD